MVNIRLMKYSRAEFLFISNNQSDFITALDHLGWLNSTNPELNIQWSMDPTEPASLANKSTWTTPDLATDLPVFGLGTPIFYVIHCTALPSLFISIIASSGVLVWLLRPPHNRNFFKRPIGDRLVVYLSFCDLLYG